MAQQATFRAGVIAYNSADLNETEPIYTGTQSNPIQS